MRVRTCEKRVTGKQPYEIEVFRSNTNFESIRIATNIWAQIFLLCTYISKTCMLALTRCSMSQSLSGSSYHLLRPFEKQEIFPLDKSENIYNRGSVIVYK